MKRNIRKDQGRWVIRGAVTVLLAGLIFFGLTKVMIYSNNSKRLQVVAAENFWGNIAAQIGGNQVDVTSIITNPNADPHLYESDAHDAIAVSEAGVVIENGVGYDDFMDKLLSASPNSNRRVLSAAKILGVTAPDANPHLWYNTPEVPRVAGQMAQAFAVKDPSAKAEFASNLVKFDDSLDPILNAVAEIKQRYAGEPVAYTERVPGYLLANAGLTVETPVGFASAIEDGVDPSPYDTLEMNNLITEHRIKVLLYNEQTVSPVTQHVEALARENGIPVVGVTETMPSQDPTYQSWQLNQVEELGKALGGI